jgi:peptidoglycan/LPS O-acetylase OafA/YrhL
MQQKVKFRSCTAQHKYEFRSNFRYDINALRAIAITGVIFFHYKIRGFTGGFSGVDIFFVISGYLMTQIIINSIDNKSFKFIHFYQKRLKRLVPALSFLIGILSVICFFIYLPEDYKINQKNASASILFLSNIFYYRRTNYFDPASDVNILLHTWSLSVEWQFYLFYPIVLFLLKKLIKNNNLLVLTFLLITLVLFIASIIDTNWEPIHSFYLLPTRAWEMFCGGISYFAQDKIKNEGWRMKLSLLGYGVIFLSFILLGNTIPWPSFYTLIPVVSTFLIIVCNYNDFKLLKSNKIKFVALISYSLYLWHWPIYVILQYIGVEFNSFSIVVLCLIVITIAYISYKYIENSKLNIGLIIVLSSIILAITMLSSRFSINRLMFKPKTLAIADYENSHRGEIEKQMSMGHCFVIHNVPNAAIYDKKMCLSLSKNKKNILLIGDSHAAHLSESLHDSLGFKNVNLLQATVTGGLPVVQENGMGMSRDIMGYVYRDFIPNNSNNISAIIISANWANKMMDTGQLISALKATIDYLKHYNINVVIIGQNETYIIPYTSIAAKDSEYGTSSESRYLNKDSYELNVILKSEFKDLYVDIMNTDKFPHLSRDNTPYMVDQNHFSIYGASLATHKILANPTVKALINASRLQNGAHGVHNHAPAVSHQVR